MQTSGRPVTGQYGDRIARGAALLDEKRPGWREQIDLDKLELSNCTSCVLGQLAGGELWSWERVKQPFAIGNGVAQRLGFMLSDDEVEAYYDLYGWASPESAAYAQLTQEWRQYIEATR